MTDLPTYSSTRYVRVSGADANGKRFRTTLRVLSEGEGLLYGEEVDRYGNDRSFFNDQGEAVVPCRLISKELITKTVELRLNQRYGLLEEPGKPE